MKKDDQCEVKGCKNKYVYVFISHEYGDKQICKKCKVKYLTPKKKGKR